MRVLRVGWVIWVLLVMGKYILMLGERGGLW